MIGLAKKNCLGRQTVTGVMLVAVLTLASPEGKAQTEHTGGVWSRPTWNESFTLPTGSYQGNGETIRLTGKATVRWEPGSYIHQAHVGVGGHAKLEITGTLVDKGSLELELWGSLVAQDSGFADVAMSKAGDLGDRTKSSTSWQFKNCVFSGSFMGDLIKVADIGVSAQQCTFVGLKTPEIKYRRDDVSQQAQSEGMSFEKCVFADCEITESFLLSTVDCVFRNCRFTKDTKDWGALLKKPHQVTAYWSGFPPASYERGDLKVDFDGAAPPFTAGASLRYKAETGSLVIAGITPSTSFQPLGTGEGVPKTPSVAMVPDPPSEVPPSDEPSQPMTPPGVGPPQPTSPPTVADRPPTAPLVPPMAPPASPPIAGFSPPSAQDPPASPPPTGMVPPSGGDVFGNDKPDFKRSQSTMYALVVVEAPGKGHAGAAERLTASVIPTAPGRTTDIEFNQKVGEMMQSSLEEAIKYWKIRYPKWPSGKRIELFFEDRKALVDGDSAGVATTLILGSLLEGWTIDPNLAVTGAINSDGSVQTIGGLEGKIRGATTVGCKRVAAPMKNRQVLSDMMVMDGLKAFADIEVFLIDNIDEAKTLAMEPISAELTQASALFAEVRAIVLAGGQFNSHGLNQVKVRENLAQIIKLAPNHASALLMQASANGNIPKKLSPLGALAQLREVHIQILRSNVDKAQGFNLSRDELADVNSRLTRLRPKLPNEALSAADAMKDFSEHLRQTANQPPGSVLRKEQARAKLLDLFARAARELAKYASDLSVLEDDLR